MKAIHLALAALAFAPLVQADTRQEVRKVSGFDAVSLAVPVDLVLTQGDSEGLTLEGDADALAQVETVVEDGTLRIRTPSHMHHTNFNGKLKGHVTLKSVRALDIAGAGTIRADSLHSTDLHLAISGAGDIDVGRLDAKNMDLSIAGSGDVRLAGKVDATSASITGAGALKAPKLEARRARVSIAGSGDVTLWAREKIDVSIAGSGDVRYYGDPAVSRSVMGSGSIKRLGASPG